MLQTQSTTQSKLDSPHNILHKVYLPPITILQGLTVKTIIDNLKRETKARFERKWQFFYLILFLN